MKTLLTCRAVSGCLNPLLTATEEETGLCRGCDEACEHSVDPLEHDLPLMDYVPTRLLSLPAAYEKAAGAALDAALKHEQAVRDLKTAEARLLLKGLDGKNEDLRKAQLWDQTTDERERVEEARAEMLRANLAAEALKFEAGRLRDYAALVGGRDDA